MVHALSSSFTTFPGYRLNFISLSFANPLTSVATLHTLSPTRFFARLPVTLSPFLSHKPFREIHKVLEKISLTRIFSLLISFDTGWRLLAGHNIDLISNCAYEICVFQQFQFHGCNIILLVFFYGLTQCLIYLGLIG